MDRDRERSRQDAKDFARPATSGIIAHRIYVPEGLKPDMNADSQEIENRLAALESAYDTYVVWSQFLLSSLTLGLIVLGLISFGYFRYTAQRIAREVGRQAAREVARERVDEYFQSEFEDAREEYKCFFSKGVSEEIGDHVGERQDDEAR